MKEQLKIPTLCEHDIDLLLLEEFISSESFGKWFIRNLWPHVDTSGRPELTAGRVVAEISVSEAGRESDLIVSFVDDTSSSHADFLIENKIDAKLQPKQAEDYTNRANARVAAGLAQHASTVLIAPQKYFASDSDRKGFDHRLTYEQVRKDWFLEKSQTQSRGLFKAGLLALAIEKARRRAPVEDPRVTAFWQEYSLRAQKYAPELGKLPIAPRPANSTEMIFKPPTAPRSAQLAHKTTSGHVDLGFASGTADSVPKLQAFFGSIKPREFEIRAVGKSAVLRTSVPKLAVNEPFSGQLEAAIDGILAANRLLGWYGKNRAKWDEVMATEERKGSAATTSSQEKHPFRE